MSLDKINFNKLSESIDALQNFLTIFKEAIAPLTNEAAVERNPSVEVPASTEALITPKEEPIPEPIPDPIPDPIVKEEVVEPVVEQPSSSAVASEASRNIIAPSPPPPAPPPPAPPPPAPKRRIEETESDVSKRARIAEPALIAPPPLSSPPPPPPINEFTIFNFKGESPLTHAAVVWNLRLLGIDEVPLTDVQLIHGDGICKVSSSMDVKYVKFRALGQLEERLNGWVDRAGNVEQMHQENLRNYANPLQYAYLLNDVTRDGIAIFALYFFTAQEIMQGTTWRPMDCRLAPKYVELRYEQGTVRLAFADLLTPNWLPLARIAFTKVTKALRKALNFNSKLLGHDAKIWSGKV